jgi:long-chain acyl-CoA synthetase
MLYRALTRITAKRADKIAVVDERRSLTFARLLHEVESAAPSLQALGVKAGDSILLGVPPSADFYIFFYAACALGATVIPVLPSGKIPTTIRDAHPVLAVGDPAFLKMAKTICPGLRGTIDWDRARGVRFARATGSSFKRGKLIRQEKILAILTSGTTGEPSLHFTTAETLLRHGELRANVLGITADDVILSTRPFNNMSSIDAPVILPIVTGCKVVVRERFQRFEATETISRERVTVVYGVPIIFEMLASVPSTYTADFSELRLCVSGGAPLPRFVFDKFFKRFGIRIQQRYGGTQFFPAFNFDTRGIPGTVGHVNGPFPMTVVSERGNALPPGTIGEIVLDFSRLKKSFWKSCLRENQDRHGKYIYTGDLGRIDTEGNLHIVGRKSPFIKVGGNRVAPAEVESVLRSHHKVKDTVVFAHRPGQTDEAVHAIVVPSGRLTLQELLAHCSRNLDPYKCPRRIDFRNSLPRNAQGKVIRYQFQSAKPASRAGQHRPT